VETQAHRFIEPKIKREGALMKVIPMSVEILYPRNREEWEFEAQLVERCGRTAWRTEDKQSHVSYVPMITHLCKMGHESVLEHGRMSVELIVDRGVTHELVRHRTGIAITQESTRYCNYAGKDMEFIMPPGLKAVETWLENREANEIEYNHSIEVGNSPQIARSELPNSLAAKINITANFREWRHMFRVRLIGTTGKPHPQMKYIMALIYARMVADDYVRELFLDMEPDLERSATEAYTLYE
jgi:thymidylate synthase (FAD)